MTMHMGRDGGFAGCGGGARCIACMALGISGTLELVFPNGDGASLPLERKQCCTEYVSCSSSVDARNERHFS
jgi:hypothetical protein